MYEQGVSCMYSMPLIRWGSR